MDINLKWVFGGTLAVVFIAVGLVIVSQPKDSSDPENGHSGFVVMTDALTGCQYLRVGNSLTPRLGAAGKQIGCK